MNSSTNTQNIILRPSNERGHANHGWLDSHHTFSFASYQDPKHMNFRTLRVINEDRIQGGQGFGSHPHQDMEIVSYVVSGGLEHQDSMGNKVVIMPDEVQIMSAGTGVVHSEMNHLKSQETHFFQIWIMPEKRGIKPSYSQKLFKNDFKSNNLVLVVSKDKREGSIGINQDADIYIGRMKSADKINFKIRENRHLWVQMVKGKVEINKMSISQGDGLAISNLSAIDIVSSSPSEFLLFDLN